MFRNYLKVRVGDSNKPVPLHVVGVMKDFNYNSLHEKIGPVILQFGDTRGMLALRLKAGDIYALVNETHAPWKKMAPGIPMGYTFLEKTLTGCITPISRPLSSQLLSRSS